MSPDAAPIVAAQTLLARGLDDETVIARITVAWRLTPADARAALTAARALESGDGSATEPGPAG